jgi:hypothetical protein
VGASDLGELGTGDLEEFRSTGHALVDAVADHLGALPEQPVWQPVPDDLRAEMLSLPLRRWCAMSCRMRWGMGTRGFSAGSTRRRRLPACSRR